MNGLRLPCCFQLSFVPLSALYLTARFFVSLLMAPAICGSHITGRVLFHRAQLIRFPCQELQGSHRFLYDLFALRHGLRPRRCVSHSPSSPDTFRPRFSKQRGPCGPVFFRGSSSMAICSLPTLPASIALHGQGLLPAARTCFAGRVWDSSLPQGRVEWFLVLLHLFNPPFTGLSCRDSSALTSSESEEGRIEWA